MHFRWLIPIAALLLADAVGFAVVMLLPVMGFGDHLLAVLLAVPINIALALFFGAKVGASRLGSQMTPRDMTVGVVVYGALYGASLDMDIGWTLVVAITLGRMWAFVSGVKAKRPSLLPDPRAAADPDAPKPAAISSRRKWLVGLIIYLVIGVAIAVPVRSIVAERAQEEVPALITGALIAGWPALVAYGGYSLVERRL